MTIEICAIVGMVIALIGMVISVYMMIRNEKVYKLRMMVLNEASQNIGMDNKWYAFHSLLDRYSYYEMMWSLRSIKSLRREFLTEIKKIKNAS